MSAYDGPGKGIQAGDVVQFGPFTEVVEYDEDLFMWVAGVYPLYQAFRQDGFKVIGHISGEKFAYLRERNSSRLTDQERWWDTPLEEHPERVKKTKAVEVYQAEPTMTFGKPRGRDGITR